MVFESVHAGRFASRPSVAGMTTPDPSAAWTHPAELKDELLDRVPRYVVDVNLYAKPREMIFDELLLSLHWRLEAALLLHPLGWCSSASVKRIDRPSGVTSGRNR